MGVRVAGEFSTSNTCCASDTTLPTTSQFVWLWPVSDTKLIVDLHALHNVLLGSQVFRNIGVWATTQQGGALDANSGHNCVHAIR